VEGSVAVGSSGHWEYVYYCLYDVYIKEQQT
jgi:hypothetical protein